MCRDYYTLDFMDPSVDTAPIAPALRVSQPTAANTEAFYWCMPYHKLTCVRSSWVPPSICIIPVVIRPAQLTGGVAAVQLPVGESVKLTFVLPAPPGWPCCGVAVASC
jgi:hypothetical protein